MVYFATKRLNGLRHLVVAHCRTNPFDLLNKKKRDLK